MLQKQSQRRYWISLSIIGILLISAFLIYNSGTCQILFTSDVHSRTDKYIGYSKLSSIVKDFKAKNSKAPILVDAGDVFCGSFEASFTKGIYIAEILNSVGYSAITLGNHDFDLSIADLKALPSVLNMPIVATTVLDSSNNPVFNPYVIIPYKQNILKTTRIAFISLLTPATKRTTLKKNTESIHFSFDPSVLQSRINELRKKADFIILLSHADSLEHSDPKPSHPDDISSSIENIVSQLSGIDLVIEGHTHFDPSKSRIINNVPVLPSGKYLQFIGSLQLTSRLFLPKKITSSYIDLDQTESIAKDTEIEKKYEDLKSQFGDVFYKPIAFSTINLEYDKQSMGKSQTKLGRYLCDALRSSIKADLVLINAGGIRASIKKGPITIKDIVSVFPYQNFVQLLHVDGTMLKYILETSYSQLPESASSYLQSSSNLEVKVDPNRPVGSRVISIKLNSKPVSPKDSITLALNNYLLEGHDGYDKLQEIKEADTAGTYDSLLADYMKVHFPLK